MEKFKEQFISKNKELEVLIERVNQLGRELSSETGCEIHLLIEGESAKELYNPIEKRTSTHITLPLCGAVFSFKLKQESVSSFGIVDPKFRKKLSMTVPKL